MSKNVAEKFWQVGKVTRAQGLKGELYISLRVSNPEWLKELKTLRLVAADKTHELTVARARAHQHGLVIQTDEIKDRTQAEVFRGAVMEVPESFLTAKPGENLYLRELLDFQVFQHQGSERKLLGQVKGFSSNGAQDLLEVETPRGMVEVPLVKELIRTIDLDKQTLDMDLPVEFDDPQFWKA